jgi:hypothetical protein
MTFDRTQPLSYIQYNIKGQTPEPYFQGGFFISLGDVPSGPAQADVVTTGGRYYGSTTTHVELFRDEQSKTFWMRKEADNVPFVRQSGLPRDFPFDSTTIDFDTTFKPALPLSGLMIRNFDPSFYIPCDMVRASSVAGDTLHLRFEMRRNPLVQLMASVVFVAAALFALIIPFSVKKDALPTAVSSFFFSVWSTRGILSSEMTVFPTRFDVGILFLCVLLMLLIGIRVLMWWIRPSANLNAPVNPN